MTRNFGIADPVIHRAGFVVADAGTLLENGYIVVESGLIKEIGSGRRKFDGRVADHGDGIIVPALTNTHTHLELSALKDKIPLEKGFRAWVRELLRCRGDLTERELVSGASAGIDELLTTGSLVCGEVSTLGLTKTVFFNSGLQGVWFLETLGNPPFDGDTSPQDGHAPASHAAHGPHTTSPELMVALKGLTRRHNSPFSIHLAESRDEAEFIKHARGEWADFLSGRGIDFAPWNLPAESPVCHLEKLGVLDSSTLAVHMIFADRRDFEILAEKNVNVCLCLRSNINLHAELPDVSGMLEAGLTPCLGTDSLASVNSLDILDETAFMAKTFPSIPPAVILQAATINGARALGLGKDFGTIEPGKQAAFLYAPVKAKNTASALEALLTKDFDESGRLVITSSASTSVP